LIVTGTFFLQQFVSQQPSLAGNEATVSTDDDGVQKFSFLNGLRVECRPSVYRNRLLS
jgi:hypothetical protein